jgi:hypothetical protein
MAKLSVREVKGILAAEKADALSAMSANKLSEQRRDAMEYFLGDMSRDMPKITGRSSVISTDVADTIDGLMPGLLEIFCGSDEVVRFDPVGPEDVEAADQESQYVSHVFMNKNPGFTLLQTGFLDGLLSKTGIFKVWWEQSNKEEHETYLDQDDGAFALLAMDPENEIVEHTQHEESGGEFGQYILTHDVTIRRKYSKGCAKVENVPPEEFGVARRTKRIQDCPYCFHEPSGGRLQHELIEEGYDEDQIKTLNTYNITGGGMETKARDSVDESSTTGESDGGINPPLRPIQITEHYCRLDYEGDGKTALYKITTGGDDGVVLLKDGKPDIVRQDYVPFAVLHPDPLPHRFFGRSIADKTMETQRIKTKLTRELLDNLSLMNNQQVEIAESHAGPSTIDDLINKKIGGIVRTKQPGGLMPVVIQPIADSIIPHLQYFDSEREWRTGVTRQGMGLDAAALQNQTATAAQQLHNATQAKLKRIARNFADGVEDLFWLLHAVIRKNGSQPDTVRLREKWVQVDPRQWKSRDDMSITVGLGSGGKQEQLNNQMLLIQSQDQAAAIGMVRPKHFYQSAKDLIKILDKKDVSLYFQDPGEDAEMPDNTMKDPAIIKAQMDGQIRMQELQAKNEIEKTQAQADIVTNNTKVQGDLALAREKMQMEMAMKQEEHAMKMQEMRMKMASTMMSAQVKAESEEHTMHHQTAMGEQKMQHAKASGDQKLQGQAAQTAMKMGPKDKEGKPQPNMKLIEQIMAGSAPTVPTKGKTKKRLKKVGPGEWEVTEQ